MTLRRVLPRLPSHIFAWLALIGPMRADAAQPTPGDKMIDTYLAKETAKLSERFLDGAKTLEEWQAKRPRLRQEYFEMLGLWPLPDKTPLHATVTGNINAGAVIVEKVHFQSRPRLYVTGNLYRPKNAEGKLPAVLYVCGHSGRGRDGNKTAFQDHGRWFASNGYVCLVIDTLQLGEIPGVHHGTYRFARWWWQSRGYTPAGVECWNGIRALDYLCSRPDVDAERIAVTGISGGGAATFWIAAADERVKCAVPVSGMSDLESYVSHKVLNGHCDCMFLINTYQWEWTTIAALIAPRPLLFCNSDHDVIFPMDGNERVIARLRKVYQMYGESELVDAHVSQGGHDYRPDLRIAVFQWINKHLKGESALVQDTRFNSIAGRGLRVFNEDKDLPADAINGKIDESFVPQAVVPLPEKGHFQEWKMKLMSELRNRCFRSFPDSIPAIKDIDNGFPTTEPGIQIEIEGFISRKEEKTKLTLANLTDEDFEKGNPKPWVEPWEAGGVAILTRGVNHPWTAKSPPNYVERAHALLGHTVDERRVFDLIAVVRWLSPQAAQDRLAVRLVGRGQAGIIAAYAALLEPSVAEVVVVDPPASHRGGPIFLNVLRVLDVPDALGMLAPRKLTLINARDHAFDKTVQLYKLAGAADKLELK
jgi:dienelactone hydrolase